MEKHTLKANLYLWYRCRHKFVTALILFFIILFYSFDTTTKQLISAAKVYSGLLCYQIILHTALYFYKSFQVNISSNSHCLKIKTYFFFKMITYGSFRVKEQKKAKKNSGKYINTIVNYTKKERERARSFPILQVKALILNPKLFNMDTISRLFEKK